MNCCAAKTNSCTRRTAHYPTTQMVETQHAGVTASEAKDGLAPESRQDDVLREK